MTRYYTNYVQCLGVDAIADYLLTTMLKNIIGMTAHCKDLMNIGPGNVRRILRVSLAPDTLSTMPNTHPVVMDTK